MGYTLKLVGINLNWGARSIWSSLLITVVRVNAKINSRKHRLFLADKTKHNSLWLIKQNWPLSPDEFLEQGRNESRRLKSIYYHIIIKSSFTRYFVKNVPSALVLNSLK